MDHSTKKVHTGLDIKEKTNILGDAISVYNPKATKLMKIKAAAKKAAEGKSAKPKAKAAVKKNSAEKSKVKKSKATVSKKTGGKNIKKGKKK